MTENWRKALLEAAVGDCITFGQYLYTADRGKKDIEWIVLARETNRLLVISQYALECMPYSTEDWHPSWETYTTWETSKLCCWLNEIFYRQAFSDEERAMIHASCVPGDVNEDYGGEPNDTYDALFLLSINEARRYFPSDEARRCRLTPFAAQEETRIEDGCCIWWLRTNGISSSTAANVRCDGSIHTMGNYVDYYLGVRPAMWVSLEP